MKKLKDEKKDEKKEEVYNPAKETLRDALYAIDSNSKVHGDTEPSFTMIAELWSTYLSYARDTHAEWVFPHDVAQMMVLLKIARAVHGRSEDNFVDQAGYSSIAALLRPLSPTEEK